MIRKISKEKLREREKGKKSKPVAMSESDTQKNNAAMLLNPCLLHLQKLRLELNCPLCLNLLNKPTLLPCNHIFCNSCVSKSCQFSTKCPTCFQHFTDQEIRPFTYLENIVAVYKSLDASLNSAILPLSSTGSESPTSTSTKLGEIALKRKNSHTDALPTDCARSGIELNKCSVPEELDANNAPEMSPGSSPSSADTIGHNRNPGGRNGGTENNGVKNSVGDGREPKRLKNGSGDAVLKSHAYSQLIVPDSDDEVSNHEECRPNADTSIISSATPRDASYVSGSVCAFCHSSKITEETGRLLYYANGKEVTRDEAAFSKSIPVHRKCIEWAPQVYFVEETVKNLASELARASKLNCSRCELKGAALGCFDKSCQRSYHVPCAMEIPDCRWNYDDFVMLCPLHKSIKFPSEKSKSKKSHSEEKFSLSSQITPQQLNFWATYPSGPQEWVLCGSALSSEEKCLLDKLAEICGATVYKSWNPNVTHVIAATDSDGAFSRTLKVLMAILEGKWILSMDWVKACVEANHPVNEEPYELNLDNHGRRDGPKTGRLRASENAAKLFDGLSFYFNGEFVSSDKSNLLDLVTVGGGTIIESMEQTVAERHGQKTISTTFFVYDHDYPEECEANEGSSLVSKRLAEAENVAKCIDAQVIPHTWIFESIAACRVLPNTSC